VIICDNFVFIHLQKCAGTTVREFLFKAFSNCKRHGSEHSGVQDIPKGHRDKLIVGTVRNPWAWYLSWWSGRREALGGDFKNLFKCDFKEFLRRCFFTETRVLHDIDFSEVRKLEVGPYTYRYRKCYRTKAYEPNLRIVKVENLRDGLIEVLQLSDWQIAIFDGMKKLNASKHGYFLKHYDRETMKWVQNMDRRIVQGHNYA